MELEDRKTKIGVRELSAATTISKSKAILSIAVERYCPIKCPGFLVYQPRDSDFVSGQTIALTRSLPLQVRGKANTKQHLAEEDFRDAGN
jgi:hypothetical protein